MRRHIIEFCFASILFTAICSADELRKTRPWTGYWGGVHFGVGYAEFGARDNTADGLCFTSVTGDASARCEILADSIWTRATAGQDDNSQASATLHSSGLSVHAANGVQQRYLSTGGVPQVPRPGRPGYSGDAVYSAAAESVVGRINGRLFAGPVATAQASEAGIDPHSPEPPFNGILIGPDGEAAEEEPFQLAIAAGFASSGDHPEAAIVGERIHIESLHVGDPWIGVTMAGSYVSTGQGPPVPTTTGGSGTVVNLNGTQIVATSIASWVSGNQSEAFSAGLLGFETAVDDLADSGGISVGGHVRYDYQFSDRFLIGIEGSISHVNRSRTEGEGSDKLVITPHDRTAPEGGLVADVFRRTEVEIGNLSSARLRFGWVHGPVLTYLSAGVATVIVDAERTLAAEIGSLVSTDLISRELFFEDRPTGSEPLRFSSRESQSERVYGSVLGGGVAFWIGVNMVFGVEAMHYDFDEKLHFSANDWVEVEDVTEVSFKLSYRFH